MAPNPPCKVSNECFDGQVLSHLNLVLAIFHVNFFERIDPSTIISSTDGDSS